MHSALRPLGAVSTHIHSELWRVTEGWLNLAMMTASMAMAEAIAQSVMKRFIVMSPKSVVGRLHKLSTPNGCARYRVGRSANTRLRRDSLRSTTIYFVYYSTCYRLSQSSKERKLSYLNVCIVLQMVYDGTSPCNRRE